MFKTKNNLLFLALSGFMAASFSMAENNGGGSAALDSLLDSTLDDLADLPEFALFPAGAHRVSIEFESKEVNKHPSIELKMKLLETLELADPETAPAAPGTETSVLFMMNNEFGQGKFKEAIKPVAAHLGVSSIREAVEGAKGMEVVVVTKQRANKDKTATYMDVVSLSVV